MESLVNDMISPIENCTTANFVFNLISHTIGSRSYLSVIPRHSDLAGSSNSPQVQQVVLTPF